jgi:hypothetical protein
LTWRYPTGRVQSVLGISEDDVVAVLRGRIEMALDCAKAEKWRSGENPAAVRNSAEEARGGAQEVAGEAPRLDALPGRAGIHGALRRQGGVAARALELLVLRAGRTSEVLACEPKEFALDEKLWTIPPECMRARRAHRVPLGARAVDIVREAGGQFRHEDGKQLSSEAMRASWSAWA